MFSLFNKRTRYPLKNGCTGWNVFGYTHGPWVYPLYDEQQLERWDAYDRQVEERARLYGRGPRTHSRNIETDKQRKRR